MLSAACYAMYWYCDNKLFLGKLKVLDNVLSADLPSTSASIVWIDHQQAIPLIFCDFIPFMILLFLCSDLKATGLKMHRYWLVGLVIVMYFAVIA